MSHTLVLVLAFSIIIPATVAATKYKKVNYIYTPFLLCTWAGLVNELLSYALIDIFHISNSINSNIYCLAEALLYTWLFRNFNLFANRRVYILLLSFITAAWLTDNLIISKISHFDSYFTILYSLIIVFMSITIINRIIVSEIKLFMNPIFLICIAFVIYFSLLALMEIFGLYGLNSGKSFRLNLYRIMAYINFAVNLIFAIAILWMHKKREFTPLQ